MANVLTDEEDELTQDEEQRRLAAQQTIGSMPRPNTSPPQTLPASTPPPDVGATSTPANPTISEVAPYNPPAPPAPRPESQAFTDWQAQDLAKHPVDQPRYHGLARAADTIANMTWPGQLAEEGGEFGTRGAEAKSNRLAGNAAKENTQIQQGEQERTANATLEKEQAGTEAERIGSQVQQLPLPNGGTAGVMTERIASPTSALITSGNRLAGVEDTNQTRTGIAADTNKTKTDIESSREGATQKIAQERIASAERIANGHNLVSTEVARMRAAAQNDPNKLTVMMRTQKQQAQATLPAIDRALDETEKVANLLGPAAGRWSAFMQGEIGAPSPEYAHYADEIGFISTAVTLAHARGRMSNELFEHFQKMFDAGKQAPENMIQALNVAREWLSTYAGMGEPGSPVRNPSIQAQPGTNPVRRGEPPTANATGGATNPIVPPASGGKIIKYDINGKRI
jgi:hypothetical protein